LRILVVDDDDLSREAVVDFCADDLGFTVDQCASGPEALDLVASNAYALVVSDVRMPGMTGLELLQRVKEGPSADTPVVLMTGYGDVDSVISALRMGAEDYLQKPLNVEELAVVVDRIRERAQDSAPPSISAEPAGPRASDLERPTQREVPGFGRVGVFSEPMRRAVVLAERMHGFRTVPVLIEGETGTGKELFARLVHFGEEGEDAGPFVSINCSAISDTLFESELFGYERGAFTGASMVGKAGYLERAQGGTLFLDEIGDLPLDLQPKFLRVLQQREMTRVGGTASQALDVRIVCATNRDLEQMIGAGLFRPDLFYRLNVGRIWIPPLRERVDDIVPLAQMVLEDFATRYGRLFRFIGEDAREKLLSSPWPGNARELVNTIERAVLVYDAVVLRAKHLSIGQDPYPAVEPKDVVPVLGSDRFELPPDGLDLENLERQVIQKALALHDGNKSKTADYLGISRSALYTRLGKK